MSTAPTEPPAPHPARRPPLGAEGLLPVSPRLIGARLLSGLVGDVLAVLTIGACLVVALRWGWWWTLLVALVVLISTLQALLLTPRRVRALGYRDREEDIVVAHGLLVRSVTVTPYGRIQSVEVHEGPVERRFGLATLSFSTASSEADGTIPGLPREEAERLRELLASRGIERMQAL